MESQVSERELNHLINQFADKYRKYAGPNSPVESALRELQALRTRLALIQIRASVLKQENDALRKLGEMDY